MKSPTRQLADVRTSGQLDSIISACQADGLSWRAISRHLAITYGVTVSDETLRRWYSESVA